MTSKPDWQQVRSLFEQALELPVPERAAFLDAQCAGDTPLREEVAALLAADEQSNADASALGAVVVKAPFRDRTLARVSKSL